MQTFVNLPLKDLPGATELFTAIGFSFDPQCSFIHMDMSAIPED